MKLTLPICLSPRLLVLLAFLPVTAGAMVLLAIPIGASLGARRSGSFGKKLAVGVAVGIAFYLLSQLIQIGGGFIQMPPSLAALACS